MQLARPYNPQWSEKSDIYSLGMVLYEIVSRLTPYHEEANDNTIIKKIRSGIQPTIPSSCPKEIEFVIHLCWNLEPAKRPSATELLLLLRGDQAPDPFQHLVRWYNPGNKKKKKMELRTYKTPRKSSRKIIIPTLEISSPSLVNSSSEYLSPRAATRRQSAPHLSEAKRTNKRHTLAGSSSNTIINPNNDNANKYTTKRKGPMLSQSNPEIRTPPLHSKESSHETISLRVPSTSINRSSSLSPLPSRSTSPYASPISSTSISPTTSPRTPTRSNIEIIIDKIEETETLLNSLEVQLKCETLKRIEDEKRYSKQPFEQEMLDLESYKELSHRYSVVLEQLENNKETLSKLSGASSCPNSPLVPPVHRRGRSVTTYHLDKPAPVSQKRRTSSFGDAIATLKRDISSALAKSRNKDHKGGAAHADRADNAIHADHAGIKDAEHEERKEPEEHKGKGKHKESNHKERKENRKSPSIQIFDKESSEEMETQKNEDHVTPPSVSVEHFKQLIELKYQSENVQAPFLHNLRTKWRQYPIPD